jgi:hypothetical protein
MLSFTRGISFQLAYAVIRPCTRAANHPRTAGWRQCVQQSSAATTVRIEHTALNHIKPTKPIVHQYFRVYGVTVQLLSQKPARPRGDDLLRS